jgi:hypothetical protein
MLAALLAKPGIGGINSLKNGVCGAAFWADGRLEIWNFRLGFFDNFRWNGPRSDGTSLIELISGDEDAKTGETETCVSRACSGRFHPAPDVCLF